MKTLHKSNVNVQQKKKTSSMVCYNIYTFCQEVYIHALKI